MELMATGVPELQERAFDVVYNLSLHIQLCGDVAGPMTGGAAPDDGQPLKDMEPWLRQLLFAMLPALHSTDVQAEERVWAAAVSTLAHLAAKVSTPCSSQSFNSTLPLQVRLTECSALQPPCTLASAFSQPTASPFTCAVGILECRVPQGALPRGGAAPCHGGRMALLEPRALFSARPPDHNH